LYQSLRLFIDGYSYSYNLTIKNPVAEYKLFTILAYMARSGDLTGEAGAAFEAADTLRDHRLAWGIGRPTVDGWLDKVKAAFQELVPDEHVISTPGKTGIVYVSGAQLVESGQVYTDAFEHKGAKQAIPAAVGEMVTRSRAVIARSGFSRLRVPLLGFGAYQLDRVRTGIFAIAGDVPLNFQPGTAVNTESRVIGRILEKAPQPVIPYEGRPGFAINLGSLLVPQPDVEEMLGAASSKIGLMSAVELKPIGAVLMGPDGLYEHLPVLTGS
jgi:hypothetical protein